jgi:DNA repair photolyase
MMKKRFGIVKSYDEWRNPVIVENALELLDEELPRMKSKIKSVHLCFSTDAFMYGYEDICNMSIEIIKKINSYGIPCTALTKGILPDELSNLSKNNSYGITLISLDEEFRKKIEPGAAPYEDRINSLYKLHEKGCKTWVSIEPYPTPNFIDQNFDDILNKIKFVDKIIFGRLNYNKKVSEYDHYKDYYNELAYKVINFCNKNNIEYHIKNGTITNEKELVTD